MATIAASFTAKGAGSALSLKVDDEFTYSVSGTFTGTIALQKSDDGGTSWEPVDSFSAAASGTLVAQGKPNANMLYRFCCTAFTAESGTAVTALADASAGKVIQEYKDPYGKVIFKITEAGVDINGAMGLTGAVTLTGDLTQTGNQGVTGTVTASGAAVNAAGVGAVNGATVSAVEYGDGVVHKTVLTLASTVVEVTSVADANGVGGTKIYDFPEGRIAFLGCMADLSLAVGAAEQEFFTDGTPEGDVGIGSAAPANADALGTDATDDDYGTGAAFDLTDFAGTVTIPSEAIQQFDGTSTAKDVYVNVLVDAADIDNDATGDVEVSGTVTLTWINLGTFA